MSKKIKGFNSEQLEAKIAQLWQENPNKAQYDAVTAEIDLLLEERSQYAPKDADISALMLMILGGSEDRETVARMNNQQLCEFAFEHIYTNLKTNHIEEFIFDEMCKRLGYVYEGKE